jgi:hypothetical protein
LARILRNKISAKELLELIPEEEFAKLIEDCGIDYQVKKLFGRNFFYLLLYGLLESTRVSLRSLEDVYKSKKFKHLFQLFGQKNIKYNTISSRLSKIDIEFFENIYKLVYDKFSALFEEQQALTYKITRVDSSMVCEAANKIEEGVVVGWKRDGKKHIKYTFSLTEMLPSSVEVFSDRSVLSEEISLPKVIFNNIDKKHDNIFVFDRGLQSREKLREMNNNDIKFVTRAREVAKHDILRSYHVPKGYVVGNLKILSDEKVYLYNKSYIVKTPFRLIKTTNEKDEPLWFLTNEYSLPIDEIIEVYKRRWDIEVFFRFIKQELNLKHFLSTKINGIKVVLYMTLILSMLILIYKKINGVGYKTAKRRFYYELEDEILDAAIRLSGGDPNLVFR